MHARPDRVYIPDIAYVTFKSYDKGSLPPVSGLRALCLRISHAATSANGVPLLASHLMEFDAAG